MKIGMILAANYPEDIRVTKEAEILIEKGHDLSLLCIRRKNEKPSDNILGINVSRIDAGNSFYFKALFDIINAIFWQYPVFKRKINRFIKENQLDVLHIHDLPLANTVIKAAKKHRIKAVLDLHENFPAGLSTWSVHKTNFIVKIKNRLFFNYKRWFNYEKRMVHAADKIISVVDEMKSKICSEHGVSSEKIITVTNSEPVSFLDNKKFKTEIAEKYKSFYTILYIGGFGPHRGIDTAILALKELKLKIPNVKLLLIGKGSIKNKLVSLVTKLDLYEYVEFVDFQPFENVFTYMKMADINIIPHKNNEHTNNTVPHKLYQSLMVGKPLLVSNCTPLKRIIDETDGGFIFEADDPKSFAEKIVYIRENREEATEKSKNGLKNTIDGKYNWEHDSKELVRFYHSLK